ncbi:MAG: universal stress protein [Acidobacteriaceae bacterium]|nr:universal stress protein [Acidobacteriaceae bacterium]
MFTLRKILLPVDFSDRSRGMAPYAKAFASPFRSQLVLFHVEDSHRALRAEQTHQIKAQLESFSSKEFQGLSAISELVEGDPATKIVEYARAEQVDLIMMPTRGCGPYRRFLLGSQTAKVLHDSDCPIWTSVHADETLPTESVSYRKIASAVDLGSHTEPVLLWASGLASAFDARLLVIHVTRSVEPIVAEASMPDRQVELVRCATEQLTDLVKKLKVQAEIVVGSGSVIEETYNYAARFAADLLIIGRHEAKGLAGRLNPHAYALIRESLCPVVSI